MYGFEQSQACAESCPYAPTPEPATSPKNIIRATMHLANGLRAEAEGDVTPEMALRLYKRIAQLDSQIFEMIGALPDRALPEHVAAPQDLTCETGPVISHPNGLIQKTLCGRDVLPAKPNTE